jgi:hypothetical protein
MHSAIGHDSNNMVSVRGESERTKYKFGSVFILSVALHALALAALVLTLGLAAAPTNQPLVVPVNIVQLASSTAGPKEPVKADIPQHEAAPPSSPSTEARELSPAAKQRHPDDLTVKLQKLAELRQPILDQRLSTKGEGLSRISATSRDAELGFVATFRDFLRDQIEHHWGLDLAALHGKDFSVVIRIAITKAGVVTGAQIVNNEKSGVDAAFDEAALSARNAALLSSPLTLPPGRYPELMNVILTLNTRDALR